MKMLLRIFIATNWLILILYLSLSSTFEKYLPSQLQDYLEWEAEQDMNTESMIWVIFLILFGSWIVSSIGLFFVQSWARWVYIFSVISLEIFSGLMGPTVEHGFLSSIETIGILIEGMILYICIWEFSKIREISTTKMQSMASSTE